MIWIILGVALIVVPLIVFLLSTIGVDETLWVLGATIVFFVIVFGAVALITHGLSQVSP
ncbi:hypothetical protein G6009_00840 [Dietzia sp. SLG510A3-30A2]|nr:hypothetical protein [Dietzia sp. SLG510A3-30A2]